MEKKSNLSDEELILAYQSGDRFVLSSLVKKWHVQFCKLAFWVVKDADAAKDIAQESWVVIFKKLDTLKNPKQFKSWAISIVNRKAIDWIRADIRESKKLNTFYKEQNKSVDLEDVNEHKTELLAILKTEIDKLSTNQKVVVKLFYSENYSLNQISELLDISVGTAKSRLFHAREKLKKSLKHKHHEK